MATDAELGWIAGFFDGEGHVSYQRSYPNKNTRTVSGSMKATIPQSSENIEVLEFFQSIVGFGKIYGPYDMPNGKPQHVLVFGTNEVEKLFSILKPNLRKDKTLDFQRALMGYWTHDSKATKDDSAREIRWQKKKGCPECGEKWEGMICLSCGYIR